MGTRITIVVAVLFLACNQKVTAKPVPGSACTYQELTCPGGGCCPRGTDCGGLYPNCPANMCCANDGDQGRVFGAKRIPDAGQ